MYGLAWFPDDPDGYNLYVLHRPSGNLNRLMKINTATGDTLPVFQFETSGGYPLTSIEVTPSYSRMGNWSLVTILNRPPATGNDQLQVIRLTANTTWLEVSPSEGTLGPEGETLCEVIVRTELPNGGVLDSAVYDAEFRIQVEGIEGEMVLPISVYVGIELPGAVRREQPPLPTATAITALYPQPFNSSFHVSYRLEQAGKARLSLVDIAGRRIDVMEVGNQTAGEHRVAWELGNLPSGLYYIMLEAGGDVRTAKVVCLR